MKDLTVGSPKRVMWEFCIPLFLSVIFQQLYNLADSFVCGKFIGENALAAVGNSYEVTLIFIAFAFGCNMGCSVVVSRLFGAKHYEVMKSAVWTAMLTTLATCVAMMLLGLFGGSAFLRLINTPEEIFLDSELYLDIYVWGLPFLFFYNVSTGIFAALGDSKTPFLFLAVSSSANIVVDILFVTAFHMGVAGVAWATFLCQGISCILSLLVVFHKLKGIPTEGHVSFFSVPLLKDILAIGIPSTLQQSFVSLGNIILQSVINSFGASVIAGYAAGVKLNNLVISGMTTIGNGISNYTAQNLGAGKMERIRQGHRAGLELIWTLSLPFAILYFFASRFLLRVFLDAEAVEAMKTGVIYLRILSPFYVVIAVKLVSDGVLRGAGMMKAFMVDTFTDLILRVILALLFARTFLGSVGIWCAWPFGWSISTVLSLIFYRKGTWFHQSTLDLEDN